MREGIEMTFSTLKRVLVMIMVTVSAVCGSAVFGQPVVWDTFDDYDADSGIIDQGLWEGWDLGFDDATIYEDESFSEPNSLFLRPASDVVQVISDVSSGRWVCRVMTFVSSDMVGDGYFILLNTYSHGGPKNWSTQIVMNSGTVTSAGGSGFARPASSNLPTILDAWVEVRVDVDLDAGTQQIFYGGRELDPVHTWTSTGINEIQCVDLYSQTADGFLMDNVAVHEACDIQASIDPQRGIVPLEVTFDATGSSCQETDLEEFRWDFGDGDEGSGATTTHTYTEAGVFQVLLTITDENDLVHTLQSTVGVGCEIGDLGAWTSSDVGEPSLPGCASLADGCLELSVGGTGFGRTEDHVTFIHQPVTGDFSLTVRIRDIEWPINGRAGILVRESLESTSRMAFAQARNQDGGLRARLERRRTDNGNLTGTQSTPDPSWMAPNMWVRLDRVADAILMFVSTDGETWDATRDTTIVDLAPTLEVGLSASASAANGSMSVTFCDVELSGAGPEPVVFRRGDADDSGAIELTDAIAVLNFLFLGGDSPTCIEAADADDNGVLQLTDGVYTLSYLFSGGAAPPEPGPSSCGPDAEGSTEVGCESYTSC